MILKIIKNELSLVLQLTIRIILITKHGIIWLLTNLRSGMSNSMTCLNGKTAIVTGGNSGVGYMTTMLLASRGCKVIIACRRNAKKEVEEIKKKTNNPNITFTHLDLCEFASVRQFAENIKKEESKIDILINNAGIGCSDQKLTKDGLDAVMQANYLGHFLLTHLLIDLLKAADEGRIAFLTSGLSAVHNISVNKLYPSTSRIVDTFIEAYCNSKACNVLVVHEMAKKLGKYGIKVNAADPGLVVTPIYDSLKGPEKGKLCVGMVFKTVFPLLASDLFKAAQTPFHVVTSKDIVTGSHYFKCVAMPKLRGLDDKQFCEKIWQESERIVRLQPEESL
ncbi:retinol dehydrogenase 13-like [Coccinella septempunctata]|uniref:retinol dehydrogenase 13-like n=1 Tax=Coccinella septempunctata TaxID=41139 RepID=UPI001D07B891|nr:retinol dehydrogenase 13-like [Coccinella septempunctata]XP_044753573.1 retinol dehydrogenase 13-like [Coccinella septempunctata]XP_044753574.1 retinol dehydrogenase 13-like [Coccinella septempunctata]